jgi:hypothetical protein
MIYSKIFIFNMKKNNIFLNFNLMVQFKTKEPTIKPD